MTDDRTAARRAGDTETWDAEALTGLMSTSHGRYWMERLLDLCNFREAAYRNDGDALGMAWRDGQAFIGRYLERELERHCPDLLKRMIDERYARINRERKKQEREQSRRDGQEQQHGGMTTVEALADAQRAEAFAEAEKTKKRPKNNA